MGTPERSSIGARYRTLLAGTVWAWGAAVASTCSFVDLQPRVWARARRAVMRSAVPSAAGDMRAALAVRARLAAPLCGAFCLLACTKDVSHYLTTSC